MVKLRRSRQLRRAVVSPDWRARVRFDLVKYAKAEQLTHQEFAEMSRYVLGRAK